MWSWKELPYDCNAPKWSPASFPTGEHSSGLSAWLLLIFHPVPWAPSTLTDCAATQHYRETMTVTVSPPPPPLLWRKLILSAGSVGQFGKAQIFWGMKALFRGFSLILLLKERGYYGAFLFRCTVEKYRVAQTWSDVTQQGSFMSGLRCLEEDIFGIRLRFKLFENKNKNYSRLLLKAHQCQINICLW